MKLQQVGTKGLVLVVVLAARLAVAPDVSAQATSDRNAGPDGAHTNTGMCGMSKRTAVRNSDPKGDEGRATAESDKGSRRGCMGMMANMDDRGGVMEMSMGQAKSQGPTTRGDTGNLNIAVRTQPSPARSGNNDFEVTVTDRSGQPVADGEVLLGFYMPAMPSMNMPEMRSTVKLTSTGHGVYRGNGTIGMAGRWDVTVTVARDSLVLGTKQLTVTAR